jgi:hypothetical protein
MDKKTMEVFADLPNGLEISDPDLFKEKISLWERMSRWKHKWLW